MNHGFYSQLKRPFVALAPMAGVTDAAFRRIIAKYGKPDVTFTEFVPADGLCSPGLENLLHYLWFHESERPVVAQVYGGNPEGMRGAARQLAEMGFDGMDINMGCPAKPVEKHLSGAALICDPKLAIELIEAAKVGAGDMPVSVKTRIGYRYDELGTWIPALLSARPAAITIHARTRNEKYKAPARWDAVRRAAELASEIEPNPARRAVIIGNGDVADLAEAQARARDTGCDGVMLGRAVFGNPWLFNPAIDKADLGTDRIIEVMLEHTELYLELYSGTKPIELMKKHFKAYLTGFRGASNLRLQLMEAASIDEVKSILNGAGQDLLRADR